ncbi:LysR substrate-binding domain-containing protein [Oceanibium sediminis]|uniref:LysR substrate-binding domain-containing protein n=1 Tax=Oceanibium sediminis TaxID=2026339 RepID=UPI0018E5A481|nr:LysR substrate-binding domain-containing protein [Oceanibium sediminis]
MMNIDTALLRTFVSAVELGGFHRAATAVHRSQSTISMQLKKLEDQLGVQLFQKSGRSRVLTREGEEFALYARRLLSLHDQALDAMRPARTGGFVRIGVMDDYAIGVLPAVIASFLDAHPDVDVEITSGFSDRLVTRLGEDFDLVLSTHPVGTGRGKVLRHERTRWAYSAAKSLPATSGIPLALLPPGNLFRKWALRALEGADITWRIAFTGSSIATVEAAAAAGIGVTVAKEKTANSALRFLDAAEGFPALPDTEIVLNRTGGSESKAAQLLGDHIIAAFADEGVAPLSAQ